MKNTRNNHIGGGLFNNFGEQLKAFNPFGGKTQSFSSNCKEVKQTLADVKNSLQNELKKIESAIKKISDMELNAKSTTVAESTLTPIASSNTDNLPQDGGGRRRRRRRKKRRTRQKRIRKRRRTRRR